MRVPPFKAGEGLKRSVTVETAQVFSVPDRTYPMTTEYVIEFLSLRDGINHLSRSSCGENICEAVLGFCPASLAITLLEAGYPDIRVWRLSDSRDVDAVRCDLVSVAPSIPDSDSWTSWASTFFMAFEPGCVVYGDKLSFRLQSGINVSIWLSGCSAIVSAKHQVNRTLLTIAQNRGLAANGSFSAKVFCQRHFDGDDLESWVDWPGRVGLGGTKTAVSPSGEPFKVAASAVVSPVKGETGVSVFGMTSKLLLLNAAMLSVSAQLLPVKAGESVDGRSRKICRKTLIADHHDRLWCSVSQCEKALAEILYLNMYMVIMDGDVSRNTYNKTLLNNALVIAAMYGYPVWRAFPSYRFWRAVVETFPNLSAPSYIFSAFLLLERAAFPEGCNLVGEDKAAFDKVVSDFGGATAETISYSAFGALHDRYKEGDFDDRYVKGSKVPRSVFAAAAQRAARGAATAKFLPENFSSLAFLRKSAGKKPALSALGWPLSLTKPLFDHAGRVSYGVSLFGDPNRRPADEEEVKEPLQSAAVAKAVRQVQSAAVLEAVSILNRTEVLNKLLADYSKKTIIDTLYASKNDLLSRLNE